jgi:hypothetical protein
VDFPPPYKAPPAVQARFGLLDWIADNGGKAPRQIVSLRPLFDGKEEAEALATAGHLEALADEGLIRLQKTAGFSGWSCDVLSPGLDLIEQLHERRDNPLRRRQAARDAFLRWLFDCTLNGDASPSAEDFFPSEFGSYYGRTFTDREIEAASEWLRDEGYLKGQSFYGGGILRPVITTKGERVVESERSVNADAQQPAPYSVTTVNVTGSGNNVAANSSNVSQTTTVTMTDENSRQLLGLAESLAQLTNSGLLGLNEDQTREAALVVESLRETAERDEAPGSDVRRLLDKAKAVALAGTGTAIGQTVVAAIDQVIQALGLG